MNLSHKTLKHMGYKGLDQKALNGLTDNLENFDIDNLAELMKNLYDVFKTSSDKTISSELKDAYERLEEGLRTIEYLRNYIEKVDIV